MPFIHLFAFSATKTKNMGICSRGPEGGGLFSLLSPVYGICRRTGSGNLGGAGQKISVIIKPGTMARAVPAFLVRIPGKLTAKMGTAGGHGVELSFFISINAHFSGSGTHDGSVPRF